MSQQCWGHGHFTTSQWLDEASPQKVGAQFAETQNPCLWESTRLAFAARTAKDAVVVWGVVEIDNEAVQSHESIASMEGVWCVGLCQESGSEFVEQAEWSNTEALSCHAQRRPCGRVIGLEGLEPLEDLSIRIALEQRDANDEPEHEPGRQAWTGRSLLKVGVENGIEDGLWDESLDGCGALVTGPLRELPQLGRDKRHRSFLAVMALW